MSELSLKLMERADKTVSFGCYVIDTNTWEVTRVFEQVTRLYYHFDVIWHPYWWERLMYFWRKTLHPNSTDDFNEARENVDNYRLDNTDLLLKPCIDRPEEWQQLAIDFLETLPKSAS
jgi:hypothetical protein